MNLSIFLASLLLLVILLFFAYVMYYSLKFELNFLEKKALVKALQLYDIDVSISPSFRTLTLKTPYRTLQYSLSCKFWDTVPGPAIVKNGVTLKTETYPPGNYKLHLISSQDDLPDRKGCRNTFTTVDKYNGSYVRTTYVPKIHQIPVIIYEDAKYLWAHRPDKDS